MTKSLLLNTIARRSLRLSAALALALLAQLGLNERASAQGTMGALPDPITSRELDEYAKRLGLSSQQRAALEVPHEGYKAQFAALRDGEIEKYLSGNAAAAGQAGGRGGQGGQGGPGGGRGGQGGGGGRGGQAQGMGGRGMGIGMLFGNTDRAAIEASLRDLHSINNKIESLDNSLFDQIQGLLTEDQITLLTGVRQARERDRYSTGLSRMATFTNPSTQVDLTELVANINLSPDEKSNVQPLLMSYETSLTNSVRKLHEDASQSTVTMLDKLEKLGFTAESMQDGRRRGEMFEAFRTVWGEVMGKMNERTNDISELNRRTERSLTGVMAKDNARRLRDSFYRRAYPEVRGSSTTLRAFETVLKFEDLTEEQRTAITAMQQQYLDSADRLTEQMADAIDAQRKNRNPMEFAGDLGGGGGGGRGGRGGGDNNADEEMNKLREQRQQLVDGTRSQLDSLLGPELTEKLQQRVAEARDRGRGGNGEPRDFTATFVAVAPAGGGGGGGTFTVDGAGAGAIVSGQPIAITIDGADLEGLVVEASRDPFVPQPITGRDIEGYAKRLGLEDEGKSILQGLHAEYTDRFKQLEATEIQAVRDADDNLWQRNGEGGRPTPPEPEAVDRLYALRRTAIASINTLDEQFFNDVGIAVIGDDKAPLLDRVRQSRLRAVYNRGGNGQNAISFGGGRGGRGGPGGGGAARFVTSALGGGSSEAGVDVSSLVEQSKIEPDVIKPLDPALADYEAAATAAFQIMFESSMRLRQATDRMAGSFMRQERGGNGGGGGAVAINGDEIRKTMEEEGKASREAAATLTTLNRQTLDSLIAQLNPADASTLRSAYNRKAFPDVYRDWRSAEPRLEAALALPDLSDQQRDQVQNMTLEFRTGYETLCEQMVELERNAAPLNAAGGGPPDASALASLQERLRNREKLEFERTDLSDKMLARLRATLTEEQIQRVGLNENQRGSF